MAKIKDPNRDKAKELYLNNKNITNREIASILGINEKKVATWKYRDKWECSTTEKKNVVQQNKKCSTTNNKRLINKAKAIVVQGATIKEASKKVGLPISTIGEYSRKENWIEKRIEFLNNLYEKVKDEKLEKHLEHRIESITHLEYVRKKALKAVGDVVNKDTMIGYKALVDTINNSLDGEAKLLGIISAEKLSKIEIEKQRLEIEKEKVYGTGNGEGKTSGSIEKAKSILIKLRGSNESDR